MSPPIPKAGGMRNQEEGMGVEPSLTSQSGIARPLTLPRTLPGHWDTGEGWEVATRYAEKSRADLAMSDRSDLGLANALYLVDGYLPIQTAAKERMRWLSVQLARRNTLLDQAAHLLQELSRDHDGLQPILTAIDDALSDGSVSDRAPADAEPSTGRRVTNNTPEESQG